MLDRHKGISTTECLNIMALNGIMVTAGIITLLQAGGQLVYTALCLAQYFCLIDFLRELPLLIYVRILYFHNPESCGTRFNIGRAIDGIANQAFVLITKLPLPAFRTFVINCTSLGLSVLWIITSVVIILGGAKNKQSKCMRWPWIIVTVAVSVLDLVATVMYANDSFQTRTLSDIMEFIGGMVSGASGVELDTSWASWIMVILYSRFVVLFLLNIVFLILVIVSLNVKSKVKVEDVELTNLPPIEEVVPQVTAPIQVSTGVQASPIPTPPPPPIITEPDANDRDEETGSVMSEAHPSTRIPRAELSKSFLRMKSFLFRRSITPEPPRRRSHPNVLEVSSDRLENIIAEQQHRLDSTVIDTSGRCSPPRASQSMPQLDASNIQLTDARGRRGTTAELQGQLPWAYIPAPAHRMRDQLPPDEELPPVPLPDYTALQPVKKASVHRAASSLSSLTQQKRYVASQSLRCEYYTYK